MRSRGAFLYTNLGFLRRRFIYALMINSVAAIETQRKHKRVCLYLVVNPRKKESVDSELARDRVSKFYWLVAIRSKAWGLVSLIV